MPFRGLTRGMSGPAGGVRVLVPFFALLTATVAATVLVGSELLPELESPRLLWRSFAQSRSAVIALRTGCGCEKRPLIWLAALREQSVPTILLVDDVSVGAKEWESFRKTIPRTAPITVHHTRSAALLDRYSLAGRSAITLLRFGRSVACSGDSQVSFLNNQGG